MCTLSCPHWCQMLTEEDKERAHTSHATCTTVDCEGEKANRKSLCGEILADMPTPLSSCGHICGLVELKGCRLWRQQLAAFVLAELTGSRAVKLLQGMWFSRLDRHQFFFSLFADSRDATGSMIRMHSQMEFPSAGQELDTVEKGLSGKGNKSPRFVFVWEIVCLAEV